MLRALVWENRMRRFTLALTSLLTMITPLAAQAPSPDAGAAPHDIKSLSPAEIDDLLAGRGMGLAKPAELNSYPGPMHVLELASQLDLSPDQHERTTTIIARMRADAVALGAQIVAAERALDRAFADATIDSASLPKQTQSIARLHGALRAVHLTAHLDQRALLTPTQVRHYMILRGYVDAAPNPHKHQHR
jgi:Spy/CpxP family protein refolding chaperone